MSNIAFRDASVVIIETGHTKVRAILGLVDLLKLPSVVNTGRHLCEGSSLTSGVGNCRTSRAKTKCNSYQGKWATDRHIR